MTIGLKQKLDYSDYAGIPPDGKRYELLEGDLYVTPAPSPRHQWISKKLQRMLEAYFETRALGRVFNASIDVILTPHDVVQPDLVLVADERQVSERGIEGPPMLVVEILSPSTHDRDRGVKARRYAALGIWHYWLVDPEVSRLEYYRAGAETYVALVQAERDGTLSHPDWPGLVLEPTNLWR